MTVAQTGFILDHGKHVFLDIGLATQINWSQARDATGLSSNVALKESSAHPSSLVSSRVAVVANG